MPTITPRRRTLDSIAAPAHSLNGAVKGAPALSEVFGQNVFSLAIMRQVLPRPVYRHMVEIRETGIALDPVHADMIASAIKDWALARGATHFCHWFQPLTGLSAEKHQSFLIPTAEGGVITEFSGSDLLQGEPDASSFPSGGLRSTFEARGYTGWDPNSDAFLMEGTSGKTLCIPSVFIGYEGQALDKKTPLLRSMDALNRAALRVLKLFGNHAARRVTATMGCEQEYFLIDRRWYLLRPDLVTSGRTLFGARPAKGQELEDHYFGTITERALAFMEDVERELSKIGVPITTRHNEVAPSQYEFAPMFERAHVAADHNQLVMTMMIRIARRHGLECLLHEKPFAGINGSGKHNNWSLADDRGTNLLDPGRTPQHHAQFLVFLTAVIRAVHVHSDLLRASVATPNNDHRLGANEAPPAIMSVFLGERLTDVVQAIIAGKDAAAGARRFLDVGVSSLPPLSRHDSDRNRTSPFAFTGNKFEFRAVGSSQNISMPITVLNAIVGESLSLMTDSIEHEIAAGKSLNEAVRAVVQNELRGHEAIIFNGDSYSDAWHKEAQRRGLPNLRSSVEALPTYVTPKTVKLFAEQGILSEEELQSRYRIKLEHYIKTVGIESALMSNIGRTMILPAGLGYQDHAASAVSSARNVLGNAKFTEQMEFVARISAAVARLASALDHLDAVRAEADGMEEDLLAKAEFCHIRVLTAMGDARTAGDALELLVDDALWPLPKYSEMLFVE